MKCNKCPIEYKCDKRSPWLPDCCFGKWNDECVSSLGTPCQSDVECEAATKATKGAVALVMEVERVEEVK